MTDQPTFADLDYRGKKRKTRREEFLERMDSLIPWQSVNGGEIVGHIGVQKRQENLGLDVEWQVALKPGKRRKLEPDSAEALAEKAKASIRAKVEHPFLNVNGSSGMPKCAAGGWPRTPNEWPCCWGCPT